MSASFKVLGQSELLPRYIFAESLYARRRVLEIGAVASTLGQSARFLSTRGARIVVAADSDLGAVQEAQKTLAGPNLRFRAQIYDDLDANSFDLVIVADLAPYVRAPALLAEIARLVAKNGWLMGGLRNPAGLSLANVVDPESTEAPPTYGMLLDALSRHFRSIEVATQSPVLGYQLAFEKGEGLQVDGSLAGISEAAYFVVLAGHEAVRNFDPTWVQLPPEPLAFTGGKLEDASARARNWQERSERLKDVLEKTKGQVTLKEHELKDVSFQLEGARDSVSRLTAQLESVSSRPKEDRERDELSQRVQRVEAELQVARERAQDAEARVGQTRTELEARVRAQKDAAVEALAAQEATRLERARREEVSSQLEDARKRLATAYEELRQAQDDAASQRLDIERARLALERVTDQIKDKENQATAAHERELKLAQARSEALAAIENLQAAIAENKVQIAQLEELVQRREVERLAALRHSDAEQQHRERVTAELETERARGLGLAETLSRKETEAASLDTELQAAKAANMRLSRDIETLAGSERTWREVAGQLETRLADTSVNVTSLSDQLAAAEAARGAEEARYNRLEKDLSTAISAERTARELAQAALADAQQRVRELSDDRERLLEKKDELEATQADLEKARAADLKQADEFEKEFHALEEAKISVDLELEEAKRQQAEFALAAADAQNALKLTLSEHQQNFVSERQRLERELAARATEINALNGTFQDLQRRFEDLTRDAAQTVERVSEREQRVQALSAEIRDLEERAADEQALAAEKLTEETARGDALEAERDAAQAELKQLGDEAVVLKARLAELEERRGQLEDEGAALKEALTQAQAEAADRLAKIAEIDRAFAAEKKRAQEREATLEAELASARSGASEGEAMLRSEISALTKAKEAAAAEAAMALEEVARLETTLAKAKADAEEATAAHARVQAEAQARLDDLVAQKTGLEEIRRALEQETTGKHQALGELEQTKGQLEQRQRVLEGQLVELTQGKREAEARHSDVAGELEVLRAQHLQLKAEQASLETAHAQLQAAHEALTQAQELLQAELNQIQGRGVELGSEVTSLTEKLQAQQSEAGAAHSELRNALEKSRAEQQRLEARLAELDAERTELTNRGSVLGSKGAELETQVQTLENAVRTSRDEGIRLEQELAAERETRSALQDQHKEALREAEGLKAQLEAKVSELEAKLVELEAQKTRVAELESEKHQIAESVAGGRAENEQLRLDLEEARSAAQMLKEQIEAGNVELEAQTSALSSSREELERAQESRARAEQELEQHKGHAEQAAAKWAEEHSQTTGSFETLKAELANDRAALVAVRSEYELKSQELAADRQVLAELKTQLETLQGELSRAQSEARGHQSGKAQVEVDLDSVRKELSDVRASLTRAGGESQAAADARSAIETEVSALRSEVKELDEQRLALQNDLDAEKGRAAAASETVSKELLASNSARSQAEELLLALRVRYGEIQDKVTELESALGGAQSEAPQLREQLQAMFLGTQNLEAERARLAAQVEKLEASRAETQNKLETETVKLQGSLDTLRRKFADEQSERVKLVYVHERERSEYSASVENFQKQASEKDTRIDTLTKKALVLETELFNAKRALSMGKAAVEVTPQHLQPAIAPPPKASGPVGLPIGRVSAPSAAKPSSPAAQAAKSSMPSVGLGTKTNLPAITEGKPPPSAPGTPAQQAAKSSMPMLGGTGGTKTNLPAMTGAAKPSSPAGTPSAQAGKSSMPVVGAARSSMPVVNRPSAPGAKPATSPPPPPKKPVVEAEVSEVDVMEINDAEDIVVLDADALGPTKKPPGKP